MPLADLRGRLLDARPDRLDLRDRPYLPRVSSLRETFPAPEWARQIAAYVRAGHVLDQGSEGACTGFGLAAVVNYLYWRETGRQTIVSPRMLYHLAQFYDEWRGEDYTGSSCRGAIKGWHKHGVCVRELWPYTVDTRGKAKRYEEPKPGWDSDAPRHRLGVYYRIDKQSVVDMQAAIAEIGSVYVSADVHDGWDKMIVTDGVDPARLRNFDPAKLPVIPAPRRSDTGGHAFALVGYTRTGFIVQNSWGSRWGYYGFAVLPYADWTAHGSDAWVCALGVPAPEGAQARPAARHYVRSGTPRVDLARPAGGPMMPVAPARKELDPREYFNPLGVGDAYERTLVLGNDGALEQSLIAYENAAAAAEFVCAARPKAALAKAASRKLVVYAHGGLNSEGDSIERIRVMAPYFEENGCVPLFLTWRTGFVETITNIMREKLGSFIGAELPQQGFWDDLRRGLGSMQDAASERADRAIEVGLRNAGGKALWSEMKENAERAAQTRTGGLVVLADALQRLAQEVERAEIHLVGHSAGAIVHGHLLRLLAERGVRVASCHLYAPACTVEFAVAHYAAACAAGQLERGDLHLHVLSDARELGDNVGKIYRKSLLYLVSRAFEPVHKTPILGMLKSFDPACNGPEHWCEQELRADPKGPTTQTLLVWQRFFWGTGRTPRGFAATGAAPAGTAFTNANLHVVNAPEVSTGARTTPAAHGSFDNDVEVVRTTLAAIAAAEPRPALPRWNLAY